MYTEQNVRCIVERGMLKLMREMLDLPDVRERFRHKFDDEVLANAVHFVYRLQPQERPDEALLAGWQSWINESPEHVLAFDTVQRVMELFDERQRKRSSRIRAAIVGSIVVLVAGTVYLVFR